MTPDVLTFLEAHPRRIALFEAAEAAVSGLGESQMVVSKSQISWGNPKKFAFLSLPLRAGKRFPEGCLILTLGLGRRAEHPRVFQAVEPYPDRWTHHIILAEPDDLDGDVLALLAEAYWFARTKTPRRRRT